MASLSQFREWLQPYYPELSDHSLSKLLVYFDLLQKWNQRMALTALTDEGDVARVLFGESLATCPLIVPEYGRLADVGSGAGFPGLVIKVMLPAMHVYLVEPNLRKSVFLAEVGRALELNGLYVIRGRVSTDAPKLNIPKLDWITSRALSSRREILDFSQLALMEHGRVLLWTNTLRFREIQPDDHWTWSNTMILPGTKERFIALGKRRA
jgi:16S rRNA (guanine527-N7)-methyltransferase